MNFAQCVDPQWVLSGRPDRVIERGSNPVRESGQSKADAILAATRDEALSAAALHDLIGGSRGSLSVYLSQMKAAGTLLVEGEPGNYRYRAA